MTTSAGASAPQESVSVFDFLYHDPQRIGSFLSQFDENGLLSGLKQTATAGSSTTRQTKDTIKLGVPGVANGEVGEDKAAVRQEQEAAERTYDPLWANARAFLDYLEQNELIVRDLEQARFGQFTLLTGGLSILDLGLMKDSWGLRSVRQLLGAGAEPAPNGSNRQQRRAQAAAGAPVANPAPAVNNVDFAVELLGILPHTLQMRMRADDLGLWGTLKPECLATSSSDLFLKHGVSLPGQWTVLGIKDGDAGDAAEADSDIVAEMAEHGMVAAMMRLMGPVTRTMLGRPSGYAAMTPLLIFRQVEGAT